MNTATFKKRLLAKQQELLESITRFDDDARESRSAEVEDPIDQVTSSELKATAFTLSTVEAKTLEQVRAALQRIEDGTYGKCIDCGRPIEPARLEAVPWTPYCRADQEKHDAEEAAARPFDLGSAS
ncbi:MAG TPA: TraR/DksA family transcriptional regulator [Bryobacteraceae bacterium]|nr:TraR/DksA family transcriptional regulator [Bryobacteraceae bacterium]